MAQSARGSAEITDDAARGSRERGRRNGHETCTELFGKSLPTAEAEEEKSNKHEYECRRRRGEEERERRRSQSRYECNLGKEMRTSSRIRCLSRMKYFFAVSYSIAAEPALVAAEARAQTRPRPPHTQEGRSTHTHTLRRRLTRQHTHAHTMNTRAHQKVSKGALRYTVTRRGPRMYSSMPLRLKLAMLQSVQ